MAVKLYFSQFFAYMQIFCIYANFFCIYANFLHERSVQAAGTYRVGVGRAGMAPPRAHVAGEGGTGSWLAVPSPSNVRPAMALACRHARPRTIVDWLVRFLGHDLYVSNREAP